MKKLQENLPKLIVIGFLAAAVAIGISKLWGAGTATVGVAVPGLSQLAQNGEKAFADNCAKCHGVNAAGTDKGPPLIHDIYNPGHHADESFYRAAQNGVRQHHWPFGNMPPQPQVSQPQIAAIVQYVRELQVANGITYRPHTM